MPATDELVAELARYRRAHELPAMPQFGEERPLVLPAIGRDKLSRGALHLILKEVFAMAAARMRARPLWEARAAVLESASAHWLRHTAGSHMTDRQVDLRFVRDNFGHASIATTSAYLHSEDDARHAATQERHQIGWGAKAEPRSGRPAAPGRMGHERWLLPRLWRRRADGGVESLPARRSAIRQPSIPGRHPPSRSCVRDDRLECRRRGVAGE